jgi:RNA polymerase-interacting CarD/CdnL/TRCF family regulator
MVREDSLDSVIRAPMSSSLAKKILDHMKNWKTKVSDQWKTRANTHLAMMDEGDPRACAEVYKDLRVLEQDNALSTTDRKHLKRCRKILSEELANALGQTQGEALDQMTQATQV